MTSLFRRLNSEHGMIYVLILLCAFFSMVTLSEQTVTGEAAVEQMAERLREIAGGEGRVLIVVRNRPDDEAFAERLAAASKVKDVDVIRGNPMEVRAALESRRSPRIEVSAIAANEATARWLVLENPGAEFP
ncbi:MAG TPA: hypothetical protein VD994_08665, partial [Prosthecobacter sp.]|nr:hypothetical protein [Prosthecobacter sp.]